MLVKFKGVYVSDEGYIQRKESSPKLFGHDNRSGYLYLTIKKKKYYMHRLVFMAFNQNIDIQGLDIHHKDGVRGNNKLDNLEPLTRGDNLEEAFLRRNRTRLSQK